MAAPRTLRQLIFVLAIIAAACSSEPQAASQQTPPPSTASTTQPPSTTSTAPDPTEAPPTSTATASSSPLTSTRPEPEFVQLQDGCYAGPAWRDGFTEIPPSRQSSDLPQVSLSEVDVNGDGSPDRVVVHENGDIQIDLGDAGWTTLMPAYVSYELADVADLDNDGDDELLLQRNGNNYGGIEVADLSACEVRLALSTERTDTAFYGNWCSSAGCFGTLEHTECRTDETGSFIRHHVAAVADDQLDDWRAGLIDTATWEYAVTDHRLVEDVMTTELAETNTEITQAQAFATMGNPGLGTTCRSSAEG
ncbi:MAG: VCBS repeat-containing protein [Acidimicrobiia bacterium]|nr:VCBS repeat-containing protein [Acidimicrobiia bacterium]